MSKTRSREPERVAAGTPGDPPGRLRRFSPYLILGGFLVLNVFLRHTLEEAPAHMTYAHFDLAAPGLFDTLAQEHALWRLLLPLEAYTGNWQTTSLILTYLLQKAFGPAAVFGAFNVILMVVAFVLSRAVLRSHVFALTLAVCLGFGTQFEHAFSLPGVTAWYLVMVYYLVSLFAIHQFVFSERRRRLWTVVLWAALLVTAMSYEGWLDFLVFVAAAWFFARVLLSRWEDARLSRRVNEVAAAYLITGALYVLTKVSFGYGQVPGAESDVVWNYPSPIPMIEDAFSKYLGYLYIAVTNFLPPYFLTSNSLHLYGAEKLVAWQHGYHADKSALIPMQHLFLWRYLAGVVFAVFAFSLVAAMRRTLTAKQPSTTWTTVSFFLLMVAVCGPTHVMVKARPMTSAPLLGYQVMVGVLGMACLVSYGLLLAWRSTAPRRVRIAIVCGTWGTVLFAALTRPAYLGSLAEIVGIAYGKGYPDPMTKLLTLVGLL